MTIPVQQFQILSPEQANPFLTGFSKGEDLYRQFIINKNLPEQLQQQSKARELANSIASVQAQYAPQTTQADLDQKREQTQKMQLARLNPLLGATGVAGQIGSALWLQQHPELNNAINNKQQNLGNDRQQNTGDDLQQNSALPINSLNNPNGFSSMPGTASDSILHNMQTAEQSRQSFSKYYDTRQKAYAYQQMPVDFKNQVIAQAQGLGYSPYEASQAFSNGKTVGDLAKSKGYDPNFPQFWPEPQYAPTGSTRSLNQKREQAGAELEVIGKKLSDWTAPYSSRFHGYSIKQVAEAMNGENKDSQAKYMAAMILSPEFSSIKIRALAGQVGIGAIKEISDKAMTDLKVLQPLVTPDVYKKANQYAMDVIEQSLQAANKAGNLPGRKFNNDSNDNKVLNFNGTKYIQKGPDDWETVE